MTREGHTPARGSGRDRARLGRRRLRRLARRSQPPTVAPAAVYKLVHFKPAGPGAAGKPVRISFEIEQPNGAPLIQFKTGPGPHTGVHLILVRDDLAYMIHQHPPVGGTRHDREDGRLPGARPLPARRRRLPGPSDQEVNANFQLFGSMRVTGRLPAEAAAAALELADVIDGYHFTLHGAGT